MFSYICAMIKIKEAKTKEEIKQFVKFPFSIYKNNKYWVPPIIKQELDNFNSVKNPVFKHATAQFFIALKNDVIVGRIVAIINSFEVNEQGIKKMRFGWFDVIDDIEVSKALLNKIAEIGKENNLDFIEGPVGFSSLDKTGILTEGFNHISTAVTWYNFPYYKTHLENLGFSEEKKYTESKFKLSDVNPKLFAKVSKFVKERYQVKPLNFTSTKKLMPYINEMFRLYEKTYSKLSTFVPLSKAQIQYVKKKNISFINPEYVKFVVDKNHKMIAFAVVMPSFSKALQKAKGKLFPFGIFYLLEARKNSKDAIFYLIGIDPKYQKKGITAILFEEFYNTFKKKGIKNCIRTPELEDNIDIRKLWKKFDPKVYKRRSTFKKIL